MSENSSAKISTTITVAADFNWSTVLYVRIVPQADGAIFSKGKGISTVPRRQDTVKHINAGSYGCYDVDRRADAH